MKTQITVITERADNMTIPQTRPAHESALKRTAYDSGSRKWLVNHIAWAVANNMAVIIIPESN